MTDTDVLEKTISSSFPFVTWLYFPTAFQRTIVFQISHRKKYDTSQAPEAALTVRMWMLPLLERSYAVGPRWLTQHEEVSGTRLPHIHASTGGVFGIDTDQVIRIYLASVFQLSLYPYTAYVIL